MTGNGLVAVGFCYGQSTVTPQWRASYTMALMRDAATKRRIVGEFAHESSGVHIPTARCDIVEQFLAHGAEPEWLWLVDTDATFADDALDELLAAADPVERPIVGALAFGVRPVKNANGDEDFNAVRAARLELFPTIYFYDDAGTWCYEGYPRNTVLRVNATGCHCLLIHRSVLEHPDWRADGHPLPWFRQALRHGKEMSEDHYFCLKAQTLGFPIHVHTGVNTGHVKTFVADEDAYLRQLDAMPVPPAVERVDVIVPVLHRPQNVRPLVESLRASTGLADLTFVVEPDDLLEMAAVEKVGARWITHPGTFAAKANAGYKATTAPWILLCGDDVRFHPGWLDRAVATGRDVVGTFDGGGYPRVAAGEVSPHPLIRRSYIDEQGASWDGPGIVCHEGYGHWFVDEEIATVARQRGVWAAAHGSLVEHLHPLFGTAPDDEVYRKGRETEEADKRLFLARLKAHSASVAPLRRPEAAMAQGAQS